MLLCSEGGADLVNVTDMEGQYVLTKNLSLATDQNCILTYLCVYLCRTPLMLAVLGGHTDCVHLLLERGACPDVKDRRGRTALHRGVRACELCLLVRTCMGV